MSKAAPVIPMAAENLPIGAALPEALGATAANQMIEGMLPNTAGSIPVETWRTLLSFGGWLDKGPEGGKPH
jgi:hypothetical protein